jgi:hypothetical protein
MKKILLASAALVAVSSTAAMAEVWGELGVTGGYYSEPEFDFTSRAGWIWGQFLVRLPNGFSMDLGGRVGQSFPNMGPDLTFAGLDADMFYATSRFAAGIYAGTFRNDVGYSSAYYGVQAVAFLTRMDIGAWAGTETNGPDDDTYNLGAYLAYYLNPNTAIGAELWGEGTEFWDKHAINVFVEHRLTRPLSIWAAGEWGHYSEPGFSFNSWEANIGVTWFLDPPGTSLQEHYRVMPF